MPAPAPQATSNRRCSSESLPGPTGHSRRRRRPASARPRGPAMRPWRRRRSTAARCPGCAAAGAVPRRTNRLGDVDAVAAREVNEEELSHAREHARTGQDQHVPPRARLRDRVRNVAPGAGHIRCCTSSSSRVSTAALTPAPTPMRITASQNRAAPGCNSVAGIRSRLDPVTASSLVRSAVLATPAFGVSKLLLVRRRFAGEGHSHRVLILVRRAVPAGACSGSRSGASGGGGERQRRFFGVAAFFPRCQDARWAPKMGPPRQAG